MASNNLHEPTNLSTSPPFPVDLDRCSAIRHGQRCLRRACHQGQHIASVGPLQRWDRQGTTDELSERSASALLWQGWARELGLGLDPEVMRERLLKVCQRTGVPASDLLYALFEV